MTKSRTVRQFPHELKSDDTVNSERLPVHELPSASDWSILTEIAVVPEGSLEEVIWSELGALPRSRQPIRR